MVALYTNGLVETPGADIEETTAELATQLSRTQDETMDAPADRLVRYAQQTSPQNDDIALLLLNRQR
ncbi:SpoIIE family protein phosphatase [Streptomyces sp. NPDC006333]|uniref:SpoIIE family protein phosphatase n=1 Tax=Streptomyces sp. NPDC006333 TaxID=3156753 RepID=UPI0033BF5C09